MPSLSRSRPIPCETHPSDHLPLVFRLGFKRRASQLLATARAWAYVLLADAHGGYFDAAALATPLMKAELRRAFEFFDVEDNGSCSLNELTHGLAELGLGNSTSQIIAELERERGSPLTSGEPISRVEFVSCYVACFTRQKHMFRDDMIDAFAFFDADGSGSISYDELQTSFFAACPFEVPIETFRHIFEQVDRNKDGRIVPNEFVDFIIRKNAWRGSFTCKESVIVGPIVADPDDVETSVDTPELN